MDWEPYLRVLIAAALSIPVGLERELRGKAAGLRTHVVVAVASAALGYVSVSAAGGAAGNDVTRIAAQVVSGIGFMGAGVIFASGGRVHGLTTAAALWSAMATGLCVGLGGYAIAFALMLVTLLFLSPIEFVSGRLTEKYGWEERTFHVIADNLAVLGEAQQELTALRAQIREITVGPIGDAVSARLLVRCPGGAVTMMYQQLAQLDGVRFMSNEPLHRTET